MKKILLAALFLFLISVGLTQAALINVNTVYDNVANVLQQIPNAVTAQFRAASFNATSTTATSSFAGRVGVGTTTPASALQVVGTTTSTGLSVGSLSGLLKATTGLVSVATAGTDYVANVLGDWTGTFDGIEGTAYLARANHTGTQLAATISDFVATVRTSISETITGLDYNSTTGVLSTTAGFVIPLTASTTEWSQAFASTTALSNTYIRNLFSNSATGLTYTAGTGATALTAGFNIPLTASTTNWNTFYDTPSTRITAGTNLSWSGNTLNATGGSGGGSNWTILTGGLRTSTTTDFAQAAYFIASSTTATSSFAGNVGIGTTTPAQRLSVAGNIALRHNDWIGTSNAANNPYINFRTDNSGMMETYGTYFDVWNSAFRIRTARLEMNNGFDHYNGISSSYIALAADAGNTTRSSGILVHRNRYWNGSASNDYEATFEHVQESTAPTSRLAWKINSTELLSVKSTGNIGIGTTAPASRLSVAGNGTFGANFATTAAPTNGLLVEGNVAIGTSTPHGGATLTVYNNNQSGNTPAIYLGGNVNGDTDFMFSRTNNNDVTDNDRLDILRNPASSTGSSTLMSILFDGKVGIGTTTPSTTFQVMGTTTTSGLSIGSLSGLLKQVGGFVTTALVSLTTDVSGILGFTNGGTGQSTYATGDTLYASAANTLAKLGIGATGNVLSVVGGVPAWVATSTLGLGAGGGSGTVLTGTTGQVPYYAGAGTTLTATSAMLINTSGAVAINGATTNAALNIKALAATTQAMQVQTNAVSDIAFSTYNTADGFTRFSFLGDGSLNWGAGAFVRDVTLSRTASGTLNVANAGSATSVLFGIGSTTPAGTLGVTGTAFISSTLTSLGNLVLAGASSLISMVAITEPAAPTAGILTYAKSIAGKIQLFVKGTAGESMPDQDALWNNSTIMWKPTTVTAGLWLGTAGAGAGTFANTLPTATSKYTTTKRARYANVVTTTNQVLGQRNTEAMWYRGATAGQGGFSACSNFGFDVWTNGSRAFFGLHSAVAVVSADPSALADTVGFAVDAADNGAISFLTRSATTATKASTGLTIVTGKGYRACFYAAPNSTSIGWYIKDLNTGTEASGSATLTLPTNTTFLTLGTLASNGANALVDATQIGVSQMTIQSDY